MGKSCCDLTGTSGTERVTNGDSSSVGVDLLKVEAEVLDRVDGLRGKGLVDLPEVNIRGLDAGKLQGLRNGNGGSDTREEGEGGGGRSAAEGDKIDTSTTPNIPHNLRRASSIGAGDKLAENREAELDSDRALDKQACGGTVRDLGGVTSVGRTVLGEGRLELGEGFRGDTSTDAIVGVNDDRLGLLRLGVGEGDLDGNDLGLEVAGLLGSGGLLERAGGEDVLLLAGDAELLSDVLRGDTGERGSVSCKFS